MTRNELIRKYCQLREAVAVTLQRHSGEISARDCFCDDRPHTIKDFHDEVYEWIEGAIATRVGNQLGMINTFRNTLKDIQAYDIRRERDKVG